MTHEDFDKLLHEVLIPEVVRKLTAKSDEYASKTDKLANFHRVAAKQGRTPQQALLGMQDKHIISIQDLVNDRPEGRIRPLEMWFEKITDDVCYDFLMYALEVEAQGDKETSDPCGHCHQPESECVVCKPQLLGPEWARGETPVDSPQEEFGKKELVDQASWPKGLK